MELINMTVSECLEKRAHETPNSIFMNHGDEVFTWGCVNNVTNKVAKILMEQGIKPGDRVGILGVNSASWIIAFLSLQKLGAVAVLINPCFKEKELIDCIKIADIKHLFYTNLCGGDSTEDVIKKVRKDRESSHVKIYNIERTYKQWLKLVESKLPVERELAKQTNPHELACILFTSGTTNNCKGVMLSHYSIVNNAREVVKQMKWDENDRMCLAVPLFHCFGITVSLLTSIIAGMPISLIHKYKTTHVCDVIERDKCTILNGVPSMFLAMVKNPRMKDFDLSSLKSGIIAGSPIYPHEYKEVCSKLKGMRLQTSYGLTEASPCVSIAGYDDSIELKSKSSGKVVSNIDVKIIDLDTMKECKRNEVGEIFVKGYSVTKGYLASDPVVCDAVQPDGWLRTGDLAYLDDDGYLYVVGRRKNLIIRGGENISPVEIEQFIKEAKRGLEVYVFGMKSEVLQEEIVACIEHKKDEKIEKQIKEYLKKNISTYKIPSYFLFIEEFPKNPTGKINEKEIRKIATEELKEEVARRNQEILEKKKEKAEKAHEKDKKKHKHKEKHHHEKH